MRQLFASALLTCSLMLGACVAPTTAVSNRPVAAVDAGSATPVSAARAVQVFESVCGETLPNFAGATAKMQSIGVTAPSPSGTATIYSQTEDLSFQIQDGPGLGKTCSMVFGSQDSEASVVSAFSAIGTFRQTPLGNAATYRGRGALVIFSGEMQRIGNTRYYNIRLLSER
ncbi:MAG: hypothetical protein ACRCS3_00790 [Paracoccaceae bacterium]